MVDLDYIGSDGKHTATSATAAQRLSDEIASVPGNLWHPSPRGARIIFLFSATCTDAATFEDAATGAGHLVAKAVRKLGLYVDRASGAPGFEVDQSGLRDRARFMYTPRSTVGDIPRDAVVEIITPSLWRAESLAAVAVPEATPAPKPAPKPAPRPARAPGPTAPVSGPTSQASGPTDDLATAAARYNSDHAREWPRSDADCPICGHRGVSGACLTRPTAGLLVLPRTTGAGIRGERCWTGDALDVDSHEAGRSRAEHLRAEGYLVDRRDRPASNRPLTTTATRRLHRTQRTTRRTHRPHPQPPASPRTMSQATGGWPDPEPSPTNCCRSSSCLPTSCRRRSARGSSTRRSGSVPARFRRRSAMIALGTVIGRQVAIRPLEKDSWHEFANLWGMAIGNPSERKSPAMSAALFSARAAHRHRDRGA
jgi:hypothetical protein